jgi:hypothetical protein
MSEDITSREPSSDEFAIDEAWLKASARRGFDDVENPSSDELPACAAHNPPPIGASAMTDERIVFVRARSLEETLFWWEEVTRAAKDLWSQQFTGSIRAKNRSRKWHPTEKQFRIMRRMVDDWFSGALSTRNSDELIE